MPKVKVLYDLGEYGDSDFVVFELPEKLIKRFSLALTSEPIATGSFTTHAALTDPGMFLKKALLPINGEDYYANYWESARNPKEILSVSYSAAFNIVHALSKEEYIKEMLRVEDGYIRINKNKQDLISELS